MVTMPPMIPPDTDPDKLLLAGPRKLGRGRVYGFTGAQPSLTVDGPKEQWYLETKAGRILVDSVANWASYGNGTQLPARIQVIVLNVSGYFFAVVRDFRAGMMDNDGDVYGVFRTSEDAQWLKGTDLER